MTGVVMSVSISCARADGGGTRGLGGIGDSQDQIGAE